MRKRLLSTALLTLTLFACSGKGPDMGQMPPPAVSVAHPIEKDSKQWDEFSGRLVAKETVEIRPRVNGYLTAIHFSEGGIVKKGQPLFDIDARPYQASAASARASLAQARTALDLAKVARARADKLLAAKAISKEEYEQIAASEKTNVAAIAVAQAALQSAELNVDYARISSPIDGRIGIAQLRVGNLVDAGALLTTIVSIDPMYVYFEGDENVYLKYTDMAKSGERPSSREVRNPVFIGLSNEEGYPHEGYMDLVDNQLDPATGTIKARAVIANTDGTLTPGLFARVRLLGSGTFKALLIDDKAVLTDQDRKYVYVVNEKKQAMRKDVKLGNIIDGLRVVKEGLTAADTVIVHGVSHVFFQGQPVAPASITMGDPPPAMGGPPPAEAAAK
jgi:membrane fusion protein, multidrug efflux system